MEGSKLTIPATLQLPDLSDLPQRALATHALRSSEGRELPKGKASATAGNFVRSLEVCVVSYERARSLLARALDEDDGALRAWDFLRGVSELEVSATWAHRSMRLAESLCRSPVTRLKLAELPSESERRELRRMRNAILHVDEAIVSGNGKPRHLLALFLDADDMLIDDEDGRVRISQRDFGMWLRGLDGFAVSMADYPEGAFRAN
jgi:hypothetical protein